MIVKEVKSLKVLITGATRNDRQKPLSSLAKNSHKLNILTRNVEKARKALPMPVEFFEWKNTNNLPPQEAFEDVGVINLAGENLMSARWTNVQKEKIYNSRVTSTRKLIEGLNKYANLPLEVFISVSGFNVYQERRVKNHRKIQNWI